MEKTAQEKKAMIGFKKKVKFASIQAEARRAYKEILTHPDIEYKTIRGKRLRAAAQQLMELSDGEKEWVTSLRRELSEWKLTGSSLLKIPVGYNCTQGGSPGHCGDMYCYGIRVDYFPPYEGAPARVAVSYTSMMRSSSPVGD